MTAPPLFSQPAPARRSFAPWADGAATFIAFTFVPASSSQYAGPLSWGRRLFTPSMTHPTIVSSNCKLSTTKVFQSSTPRAPGTLLAGLEPTSPKPGLTQSQGAFESDRSYQHALDPRSSYLHATHTSITRTPFSSFVCRHVGGSVSLLNTYMRPPREGVSVLSERPGPRALL